mmetsp:Transcript_12010/g.24170  ORF Transcript_12010/g.24170 Transcript_12010/m.24170 type:complete len:208 (-) Transcript_12010:738-1361(-)
MGDNRDHSHPFPGRRERPSGKAKACLGVLYFSQRRFDNEKPPICAGLSKKLSQGGSLRPPTSSEQMPGGGDFRYVCVGYSSYDQQHLRDESKNRTRHDEPVEVPYCEGLEVISAAAVSSNRELLSHGAPDVAARESPSGRDESLRRHRMDKRESIPLTNPLGDTDWSGFQERFERMSRRMIDKMQANATYMAKSFVKSWEQIFRSER